MWRSQEPPAPTGSGRPGSDCDVIGDKHGITHCDCLPQSLLGRFSGRHSRQIVTGPRRNLMQVKHPNQTPCSPSCTCEGQMERSNDEVDCTCLCFDVGVIRAGYATCAAPAAGRKGHYCPRSMWRGNAQRGRYLRENSRPPCRQQVRPWSDLLVRRFGRQRATKPLKRTAKREACPSWSCAEKIGCPCDAGFAARSRTFGLVIRSPASRLQRPCQEDAHRGRAR